MSNVSLERGQIDCVNGNIRSNMSRIRRRSKNRTKRHGRPRIFPDNDTFRHANLMREKESKLRTNRRRGRLSAHRPRRIRRAINGLARMNCRLTIRANVGRRVLRNEKIRS